MKLYDLYCPACRKAYHYELWKVCPNDSEHAICRYCGYCEGDLSEESCNKEFFLLDYRVTPDMIDPVRRTKEDNYSSATGSPVATGSSGSSHNLPLSQAAGDSIALPHPTTRDSGPRSDNGMSGIRLECPLCCVPGSIPSGSDKPLPTSNLNPDLSGLNSSRQIPPSLGSPELNAPGSLPSPLTHGPGRSSGTVSLGYGFLWDICCECQRVYGLKKGLPQDDGQLSHGYCDGCAPGVLARFLAPMAWVVLFIPSILLNSFGGVR